MDGYAGVPIKQRSDGSDTGFTGWWINRGEQFYLLTKGVVQIPFPGAVAVGDPLFISFDGGLSTSDGDAQLGTVIATRDVPAGMARIELGGGVQEEVEPLDPFARHIALLQSYGAVRLWPMNEPAGSTYSSSLTGGDAWGGGGYVCTFGVEGPYPNATAVSMAPFVGIPPPTAGSGGLPDTGIFSCPVTVTAWLLCGPSSQGGLELQHYEEVEPPPLPPLPPPGGGDYPPPPPLPPPGDPGIIIIPPPASGDPQARYFPPMMGGASYSVQYSGLRIDGGQVYAMFNGQSGLAVSTADSSAEWVLWTAVTEDDGTVRLYRDREQVAENEFTPTPQPIHYTRVRQSQSDISYGPVSVINRALTPEEIAAL